jgi:serine protease
LTVRSSARRRRLSSRFFFILAVLAMADLPLAAVARKMVPAVGEKIGCIVVKTTGEIDEGENDSSISVAKEHRRIQITPSMLDQMPGARIRRFLGPLKKTHFYISTNATRERRRWERFLAGMAAQDGVDYVVAEPRPRLAAPQATGTPDFQRRQSYLDTDGVNVRQAWLFGDNSRPKIHVRGEGVSIFDVEYGWMPPVGGKPGHEDLPGPKTDVPLQSSDFDDQQHGTSVVGVLAAIDNAYGITGIANQSMLKFQPIQQPPTGSSSEDSPADCLVAAIDAAGASLVENGDVVLIEVQMPPPSTLPAQSCSCNFPQCGDLPAEAWPEVREAIQHIADGSQGHFGVVVEAAGNGSVNLDLLKDENGDPLFPSYVSNAILVGAAKPYGGQPMCYTNYGTALDLESWGEKVASTGFGNLYHAGTGPGCYYTSNFGGTSSAAAIVAGVVADVESAAKSLCPGMDPSKAGLTTSKVLGLLRRTGTTETWNKYIGVRPDLSKAVSSLKEDVCPVAPAPALARKGG